MQHDRLAVQILELAVLLGGDREELQLDLSTRKNTAISSLELFQRFLMDVKPVSDRLFAGETLE
ncbi:MAG: hypothetical protein P8X52_01970, partial [Limibacillus sp.]